MPAIAQRLTGEQIAVAQQYRAVGKIGVDGDAIDRHHVGTIGEPGDFAKTLGLALRAEQPSRAVQPLQRGVVLGADAHPGFERAAGGRGRDTQTLGLNRVGVGGQRGAVETHFEGVEFDPVKFQGGLGRRARGALEVQPGAHRNLVIAQVEMQLYTLHPIRRGRVIVAVNSAGDSAHHHLGARGLRWRVERAAACALGAIRGALILRLAGARQSSAVHSRHWRRASGGFAWLVAGVFASLYGPLDGPLVAPLYAPFYARNRRAHRPGGGGCPRR